MSSHHSHGNTNNNRLRQQIPEFKGVAARISADSINKYRGQFVTLVIRLAKLDTNGPTGSEVVSGEIFTVKSAPVAPDAYAQINEFTVYVDHNGDLLYHSHGTMNDAFDCAAYGELVKLISSHHASLFY